MAKNNQNRSISRILQKDCKDCHEKIPSTALRCSHCTGYQDWRRFFSGGGQLFSLVAIALAAYAANRSSTIAEIVARGFNSPQITEISYSNKTISFELLNIGNLPAYLTKMQIQGLGYVLEKPSNNTNSNEPRKLHSTFVYSFKKPYRAIKSKNKIITHLAIEKIKMANLDSFYSNASPNRITKTFNQVFSRDLSGECSISLSYTDLHGKIGSKLSFDEIIDCSIVSELIFKLRTQ